MDPTGSGSHIGAEVDDESSSAWLLVPSPVLGPSSWAPVAWALQSRGHQVRVAKATLTSEAGSGHLAPWLDDISSTPRFEDDLSPVTVVSHSFACAWTPSLVSRLADEGWPIDSMVLVDGRFPDGLSALDAYPSLADTIRSMIRPDDYLPPWTCWWGSLFESLIPDTPIGRQVLSEAVPVPRSFFSEASENPDLGDKIGKAFLSFGGWYFDDNKKAREAGWLATVMAGDSMHHLVEPNRVTETLLSMVAGLRQYDD